MRVTSIKIQNFKRFETLELKFENKLLQETSQRFLVLGDNGTGKTTLLQAIALPLAIASRQIRSVANFDWVGFLPARYRNWGSPTIELWVEFDQEEIEVTQEMAERWKKTMPETYWINRTFTLPGSSRNVKLTLEGEYCHTERPEEYFQFHGRYYAQQLIKTDPGARNYFNRLPGVFWFDQFRNLGTNPSWASINGDVKESTDTTGRVSYDFGVERLRTHLNGWKLAQQGNRVYRYDYLFELEKLYKRIFPGRSFAGVEMMPGIESPTSADFFFLFNDGHRTYDLVEMSAGEQSIFPILYEFVRLQISKSIVLIDEVDLNLHPSAGQLFVAQLPKIEPTCQFILTTHSEAVSEIISNEETYRLPGGALCL